MFLGHLSSKVGSSVRLGGSGSGSAAWGSTGKVSLTAFLLPKQAASASVSGSRITLHNLHNVG